MFTTGDKEQFAGNSYISITRKTGKQVAVSHSCAITEKKKKEKEERTVCSTGVRLLQSYCRSHFTTGERENYSLQVYKVATEDKEAMLTKNVAEAFQI